MSSFTDAAGRAWQIDLNYGAILRVKSSSNGKFDLLRPDQPITVDTLGETVLQVAVSFDDETRYRVLCALLEPQMKEQGVEPLDLAEALGPEAMTASREALLSEWQDFFRRLGRLDQAKAVEKMREWTSLGMEKVKQKVLNLDTTKMDETMAKLMDSILTKDSGVLPASAELTLADSLGDS